MRIFPFLFLCWSCASREAPGVDTVISSPVAEGRDSVPSVLPDAGSVCEFERGTPVEEVEFPEYQVYTPDQLRRGFTSGTTYVFYTHSQRYDELTPGQTVWRIIESTDEYLRISIIHAEPGNISEHPLILHLSWEELAEYWTFDANHSEVSRAECPWGETGIEGVRIRVRESMVFTNSGGTVRGEDVSYCFVEAEAMPPVLYVSRQNDEYFRSRLQVPD